MRTITRNQTSDAWLIARRGRVTASRMADVLSMLKKGGESAKRAGYRTELVVERICHRAVDRYVSPAMIDGIEREPFARSLYEAEKQEIVETTGFVLHPVHDWWGSSPDGLVGEDGGCEFKCPTESVHWGYLKAGVIPEEYEPQMVSNMICCEREWWDFASFNPFMPAPFKLMVVRLYRDAKRVAEIEAAAIQFNDEVEAEIIGKGLPATVWASVPVEPAPETAYDPEKPFESQDYSFLGDDRNRA